jgi:hypothetical protein
MRCVRAELLLLVAAACSSSQPAGAVHGAAPPVAAAAGPEVAIAPGQALGWIGIAPRPERDLGDWIPAGAQAAVIPMPVEGLAAGTALSMIDRTGKVARVTAGAPEKIRYGCEDNQLEVLPFAGARSAPGPVWLLPPSAPASWKPAPLAIATPVSASETKRRDTVGPLSLELARTDATHGSLTISRDGRALGSIAIERADMEGADPSPLDFRETEVAIPVPVAAWSLAEGGPFLLVLFERSYEGMHLRPILVEAGGIRELRELATYLYDCAF